MVGAATPALTVIVMFTFDEPSALVAVTVYVTPGLLIVVGVPLMTPVDVLKFKPVAAERLGLMAQDVTGPPPDKVGTLFVIAIPFA